MSILRNRNTEIKYLNRDLGSKKRMHLANIGVGTTQGGRGHWIVNYTGTQSFIAPLSKLGNNVHPNLECQIIVHCLIP